MQPGFELRIRTMIKAVTKVVIPAIDSKNNAAIEQAHLVAASLDMLVEQIDHAHWFEVEDALGLAALLESLSQLAPGLRTPETDAAIEAARAAQGNHALTLSEIRLLGQSVRDIIDDIILSLDSHEDASIRGKSRDLVLEHAEIQIGRERAFVAKTRFDVYPETLRSLRAALDKVAN